MKSIAKIVLHNRYLIISNPNFFSFFILCENENPSKSWFSVVVWVLQCLDEMSCPEEAVCCVCRGCQRDRTKISLWAAVQVTPVFTAAVNRTIWLLTAPSLTNRGHSRTRILLYLVCSVLCGSQDCLKIVFFFFSKYYWPHICRSGENDIFLAWLTEESLLSASCPLQNDANRDNTETKDANDKVED